MSTTLEQSSPTGSESGSQLQQAANRVRNRFAACRLKFKWFGISKSLSPDQKSRAAQSFGADGNAISAGKKLIDTRHEAYQALTALKGRITAMWKENSLPYPEPGIRLIRQDRVEEINSAFQYAATQLDEAVAELDRHYTTLKQAARQRLGELYNDADYPDSLRDAFAVEWDFLSVDPPDYLRQLNPELYEEQSRRVAERFERAVQLAEQAFMEELDQLVNHLAERLAGADDGKPKIFRDTAVTNLQDFFNRFRHLNVRSNAELDELVEQCEQVIRGVQPQSLRDNSTLRQSIATQLSSVQSSLDQLLVERPRRNIIRNSRNTGSEGE